MRIRLLDPLGIQGRRVLNETDGLGKGDSVWVREIVNEQYALGVVSARTDGTPRSVQFTLKQVPSN